MLTNREYLDQYFRILKYKPSRCQAEFHNAPEHVTELRLQAASQSGKSLASMINEAMDSTAMYLPWFQGKRFTLKQTIVRPHEYMSRIISTSSQIQKATLQLHLLGNLDDPHGLGKGTIPLDYIVGKPTLQRGLANVVNDVTVRRDIGGTGNIDFRSMEQDIAAFAGTSLDQVRFDEPGPLEVYLESMARLTSVKGSRMVYTATPTAGRDPLFMRFEEPSPHRMTILMTLFDVHHLSKEQIQEIIERTPEQDRAMRIYGQPAQGSGNVYETPYDNIAFDLVGSA
jgi:phage terminase large subunit-like protein